MEIRGGWATDFGKTRFDVMVNEGDLLRLLAEQGADDPEATRARMRGFHVFRALDEEVMAYECLAKLSRTPGGSDEAKVLREKVHFHRHQRNTVLAEYVPALAEKMAAAADAQAPAG